MVFKIRLMTIVFLQNISFIATKPK
uniref:Uncharacterized protein n=1 Tax=Arundo donax TaxID=35708 RepID=A0A0A9BE83_ARUDO